MSLFVQLILLVALFVSPILGFGNVNKPMSKLMNEASRDMMQRFWEIDLQTQQRMDKILSLYEVKISVPLK